MKTKKSEPLHKKAEKSIVDLMQNSQQNKLPAEEELAEMLGVSRTTIREAMNSLLRKGVLFKNKGRGNFILNSVINTKMRIDLFNDFSISISEAGYKPILSSNVKRNQEPGMEIRQILGCTINDPIDLIEWEYLADQMSAILIYSWMPANLFLAPIPDQYTVVGEAISRSNMYETHCQQELSHLISSVKAINNPEICRHFKIPENIALVTCEQRSFNIYDQCIAFGHIYFNPEILELNIVTMIP
jgi:GntR family transcriptional regulator